MSEIKMLGLDTKVMEELEQHQGPPKVVVKLSAAPSPAWIAGFRSEYDREITNTHRPADVYDRAIWVGCTREEFKSIFLPKLKSAIAVANERAQAHLNKTLDMQARYEEQQEARRRELQKFEDDLDFS